jgi:hypothetical protein
VTRWGSFAESFAGSFAAWGAYHGVTMRRRLPFPLSLFGLALLAQSAGCASIVGLDSFTDAPAGGAGGEAGGGAGAGTTGGGGAGAGTTGGGGVGAGLVCEPGTYQTCAYSGPQGTEGVGTCKAGERVCNTDGDGYGACMGEVLPVAEDCSTPADENCDGEVNELCPCNPGEPATCYGGPAGTVGVGTCQAGTQLCNDNGLGYGPCTGQVLPAAESCATPGDEDCDGQVDEGCLCEPGTSEPCYTGPQGTKSTGVCQEGMHTCNGDGLGYGPCVGEVVPSPEACTGSLDDEDCDGQVNESGAGCVCVPGASQPCYSFGTGTPGVGICAEGSQLCNAQGTGFDACTGDVGPGVDDAMTLADEDCDGLPKGFAVWSANFPSGLVVVDLAIDTQGNVVLVGGVTGSVMLPNNINLVSAGSSDVFVVKLDPQGAPLWGQRYGDGSAQAPVGVAVDAQGNIAVGFRFAGSINWGGGALTSAGLDDVGVVKLDPNGTHLWSKKFGDASDQNRLFVAFDPTGNVLAAGDFAGVVNFGGGNLTSAGTDDVFAAKLNAAGTHVWSKRFGDAVDQRLVGLGPDPVGGMIFAGSNGGTVNLGGSNLTGPFVGRLDENGNHSCSLGLDVDASLEHLAVHSSGAFAVAGSFSNTFTISGFSLIESTGTADGLAVGFTSQCGFDWFAQAAGNLGALANRVTPIDGTDWLFAVMNRSDTLHLGGSTFPLTGAADGELGFARYNNGLTGVHVWSKAFANPGIENLRAIRTGPAGQIVLAYSSELGIDLGAGLSGPNETVIAQFAP